MAKQLSVKEGDVFNRLTIIKEVDKHIYPSGETRRKFLAQCSCGSEPKSYLFNQLTTGKTKSCGCLDMEQKVSHGMYNSRQYQIWADMKTRCDCKNNKFYDYYGGRGVTYCDKWKTFEGFWEDMQYGYSDDLTINRRNNDGNYCKENCAWDTRHFQGHMRRKKEGTLLSIIGGSINKDLSISASIKIDEERIYLGTYSDEKSVAKVYDDASERYYGDRPNKTAPCKDTLYTKAMYYLDNINNDLRKQPEKNPSAKLSPENVLEIVSMYDQGFKQKDIAATFNITQCTVSSICRGDSWSSVTGINKILDGEYKVGNNAAEIH